MRGEGVDLGRFARVSRVGESIGGCVAAIDVDLTLRREGADGHTNLELTQCKIYGLEGGAAGIAATFQGRTIAGRAHAELADVARIELASSSIEIGGRGRSRKRGRRRSGG